MSGLIRAGVLPLPPSYVRRVSGLPVLARLFGAPIVALLVSRALLPEIIAARDIHVLLVPALLTVALMTLAFPPPEPAEARPRPWPTIRVPWRAAMLVLLIIGVGEPSAYADDCGFEGDTCFGTAGAAVAAGIGAGVAAWWAWNRLGKPEATPSPDRRPTTKEEREQQLRDWDRVDKVRMDYDYHRALYDEEVDRAMINDEPAPDPPPELLDWEGRFGRERKWYEGRWGPWPDTRPGATTFEDVFGPPGTPTPKDVLGWDPSEPASRPEDSTSPASEPPDDGAERAP